MAAAGADSHTHPGLFSKDKASRLQHYLPLFTCLLLGNSVLDAPSPGKGFQEPRTQDLCVPASEPQTAGPAWDPGAEPISLGGRPHHPLRM